MTPRVFRLPCRLFGVALLLVLWGGHVSAGDVTYYDPGEAFDRIERAPATPALDWYTGAPGKGPRVLVLGSRHSLREVVELRQRMPMQVTLAPAESRDQWYHPYSAPHRDPEQVLARLRQKLEARPDVVIFAGLGLRWGIVPPELRFRLLETVSGGTGLLFVTSEATLPEDLEALPWTWQDLSEQLGPSRPKDVHRTDGRSAGRVVSARVARLGRGRMVHLRVPRGWMGVVTGGAPTEADYEHAIQLGMRALLVAADRPPAAPCATWRVGLGQASTESPQRVSVEVAYSVKENREHTVVTEAYDTWTRVVHRRRDRIEPRDGVVTVDEQLPAMPAGRYLVRTVLADPDGRRLNWTSSMVDVSAPVHIDSITSPQPIRHPGRPAPFIVKLSGKADAVLRWCVYDNDRRIVSTGRQAVDGDRVELSVDPGPTRSVMNHLELDLVLGDVVMHRRRIRFGVQQPVDTDDISLGYWGRKGALPFPEAHLQRLHWQRGIDFGMFRHEPVGNVRPMGWAGQAPRVVWKRPDEEPPCHADEAFRREVAESMQEHLRPIVEWSPVAVTLGDEPSFRYTSTDPVCMRAWQAWLKTYYGTLDKLNRRWSSSYRSWDEIPRLTDAEARHRHGGNPAAGTMSWRFNLHLVADFYAWQQRRLDETLPGLRAGPEGIWPNPGYYGIDLLEVLRTCNFTVTYVDADTMATVRLRARPGTLRGAWTGGYYHTFARPELLEAALWQTVLQRMNALMWFAGSRPGVAVSAHPTIDSGWGLNDITRRAFTTVDELKGGLGRLLLKARRLDDPVTLVIPHPGGGGELGAWLYALESAGLAPRLVVQSDLTEGVDTASTRLVVLAGLERMDIREIVSVRRYIESGGRVVFDGRAGAARSDGSPRKAWPFADWFAEVKPGEAVAVGRGRAWLLAEGFLDVRLQPVQTVERAAEVLKQAGVSSPVRVVRLDDQQRPTPGLQVVRYNLPGASVVVLNRRPVTVSPDNSQQPWALEVTLPASSRPIDRLVKGDGKIDGRTWRGTLAVGRPVILACLAKPLEPIRLSVASDRVKQGGTVELEMATTAGYDGVVRLDVTSPDGTVVKALSQNLDLVDGQASVRLHVAHNEQPGPWRLRVRDVLTGASATLTVTVSPPPHPVAPPRYNGGVKLPR